MVRVSNGYARHKRHKKFTDLTKWFRLWRKNVYQQVRLALIKQWEHQYRNRKEKKREFRRLWIERISASCRERWLKYSVFTNNLYNSQVKLDRKVLSNIAVLFPKVFNEIVETSNNK